MTQAAQKQNDGKKPQTAITPTRSEDFASWYQSAIKAADMAENSPVRGCMIIKPYGYAIWENVQRILGGMITEEGVQNAYFPLLIPLSFIAKEAEHIDGFAKECAVVTHHRLEKNEKGELVPAGQLAEPFVIRPTSETIIGDSMAQWVQSYRDLPLKLNQWCNVMRWEMRPRMFLRSAEFLWQEGHNCFETADEGRADALRMLDVYADFIENAMAIPVIKGEKTPDERFPGAIATYTIEAMMQDGKALQAGTSHDLGQTFSKSAGIKFQGRDGVEAHGWTTSWGMSTRTIGGLIMVHGDDDGLIMPPAVAPYQIVIIPVLKGEGDDAVLAAAKSLQKSLKGLGLRVNLDARDERTPTKMWDAIKKGVPLRVELGAREVADGTLTHVRRDLGRDSKKTESQDAFLSNVHSILADIQTGMLNRARARMDARIFDVPDLAAMRAFFADDSKSGFVRIAATAIQNNPEFEAIKKDFAVTPRCLPFADGGRMVLVGRSY